MKPLIILFVLILVGCENDTYHTTKSPILKSAYDVIYDMKAVDMSFLDFSSPQKAEATMLQLLDEAKCILDRNSFTKLQRKLVTLYSERFGKVLDINVPISKQSC